MKKMLELKKKFLKIRLLYIYGLLLFPTVAISNPSIDFSEIGRETARILGDLIRLDTTNPPGNEHLVADYIANILKREGILYHQLNRDEGRDNLVARYYGSGKKKPILLYSHMDVVPADIGWGQWSVDPFSGEVKDGFVYGRGAIDAKGLLATQLMTLITLKRANIPLDCDVIFLAVASEETGSGPGMIWMLENHLDLIDSEVALGEGGRVWMRDGEVWTIWLQAAEKSAHNLTVTASGKAGHASVPSRSNAVERLNQALVNLKNYSFPEVRNPVTEEFFRIMEPVDARVENGHPRFNAMLHNTISVTLIDGGIKTNVIPPFASANINLRLLPGEDLEEVTSNLQAAIQVKDVTIFHKPGVENGASLIPFDTPFFETISKVSRELWPSAVVAPYLSPGTSDASKLRAAGIQAYGLMPFPLTEKEAKGIHGVDERVNIESLGLGVELTYKTVLEWAGKP